MRIECRVVSSTQSVAEWRVDLTDLDRSIDGVAKTIAEVLEKKKYSIDYYQREYKWEAKQIAELVADLTTKFLDLYEPDHARREVAKYPGYYLGSIIISHKNGEPFIVDGQQRLTSLTLILTYLRRLQQAREVLVDIDQLIFSEKFGEKSFNLHVPDRNECMEALFDQGEFEAPSDAPESVITLVSRYSELDSLFPDELKDDALPYFIDWLKDRVQLVQITAYTDEDAYAIFETMNDRGLKLTPADMLKGYLLANMENGVPRTKANELWRKRLRSLDEVSEDAGSDFLKTWLRSQYSTKIRETKKGASPEDWDRIGTEFHRWVRTAADGIGLTSKDDYFTFVTKDFDFYSQQYRRVLYAAKGNFDTTSPLRFVRFNSDNGFTLQDQLLLAPLRLSDDPATIDAKLEIVGRFIDIWTAWRVWNSRSTAYSTIKFTMFGIMREIRGLAPEPLAATLRDRLAAVTETFDGDVELRVHQQNRGRIHVLLARITDYLTVGSGQASNYLELTNKSKVKYEVEHVWADHFERHLNEFSHEADFTRHRNRLGDLLLLPKQFNSSYNDEPYDRKRPRYFSQNLLAASLDPQSYEKNPGFLAFLKSTGLAFKPYEEFSAQSVVERGELYRSVAERIWNPDDLVTTARRLEG